MAASMISRAPQSYSRPTPMLRIVRPTPRADVAVLARELASRIANAADADQWAIAVVGIDGLGAPDFEERLPRAYLEAMNDGHPARYRLTLVLRTDARDLGLVRLGTMRPPGFDDLDIARAQNAADEASRQLDEALGSADSAKVPEPSAGSAHARKQGVVIFDDERCILAVTPVAEELLGWRAEDVVGDSCTSVFDCRDDHGMRMCDDCALGVVFDRRAIVEPIVMRMNTADGRRQALGASFWYLPPSGRIREPRAMAVLRVAEEDESNHDADPRAG